MADEFVLFGTLDELCGITRKMGENDLTMNSNYLMPEKFRNKYRIASTRLQSWDYRWNGAYFVTICTAGHENYFGSIANGEMFLSQIGRMANDFWMEIPGHFPSVILDAIIIMPNHVHGIIIIDKGICRRDCDRRDCHRRDVACNVSTMAITTTRAMAAPVTMTTGDGKNQLMANISPKPGSVSTFIRSFKSAVTKQARVIHRGFEWQTRFHDHIIRNNDEFLRIQNYIINNPANWRKDKFYKKLQ